MNSDNWDINPEEEAESEAARERSLVRLRGGTILGSGGHSGYIDPPTGKSAAAEAVAEFLQAAQGAEAGSGPGGRTWKRDDLHGR